MATDAEQQSIRKQVKQLSIALKQLSSLSAQAKPDCDKLDLLITQIGNSLSSDVFCCQHPQFQDLGCPPPVTAKTSKPGSKKPRKR